MRGDNARCRMLVRTWEILQALDGRVGRTLTELAAMTAVSERTIRRDLEALQLAGFPLVDEPDTDERRPRWRLMEWRRQARVR